MTGAAPIAPRLLAWHRDHGRHDLPWQLDPTPWRIWVSEVMLQQTQVATVIPYFERFTARFPDVAALAGAPLDEVLHLWSGLGYYARARNLHRAAGAVLARHGGEVPADIDALQALPGIGRSTAGAILALYRGERHPILDGNVRRVLCRHHGVEGWPGRRVVERRLWEIAEDETPRDEVAAYTQAIMDLGATLCTRSRPACTRCPLASTCVARASGRQSELPAPRPRRERPLRRTRMLLVRDGAGRVLLRRRGPAGVWAGLWGLPEPEPDESPAAWCRSRLGAAPARQQAWAPLRHGFTHYELEIEPVLLEVDGVQGRVMEGSDWLWYNPASPARVGRAAVVDRLLARLGPAGEAGDREGE